MKRENIAIVVSIVALVVSALSLWSSWDAQRHNRIVSFEQRRQDVRQTLLQGQLLGAQLDEEVRVLIRREAGGANRERLADTLHEVTGLREEFEGLVKEFEQVPASADTGSRLFLEQLQVRGDRINKKLTTVLERVRSGRPLLKPAS